MKFANFLRTLFLQNTSGQLLLLFFRKPWFRGVFTILLTHLMPLVFFYTPWKIIKPEIFFSWIIRKKLFAQRFNYSCWCRKVLNNFNPFHATSFLLYPLKTIQKIWFFDIFRGYRKRPVARKKLTNFAKNSIFEVWQVNFRNFQGTFRYKCLVEGYTCINLSIKLETEWAPSAILLIKAPR